MNEKEFTKDFLEQYDLCWHEECYTIAKKTVKDVLEESTNE